MLTIVSMRKLISTEFLNDDRSINLPLPKQETLSRHSILGPSGLRGQWLGPSAEVKVKFYVYTIYFLHGEEVA